MNFSDKLKEIRTEKQLTQAELAASIGITVTTVNRWENGGHMPGYRNICNIANALNISALDFLDKDNTDKKEQIEIKKAYRMQKNIYSDGEGVAYWENDPKKKEVKRSKIILEEIEENKIQMKALDQLDAVLQTVGKELYPGDYDLYFGNSPKSEDKKLKILNILEILPCLNNNGLDFLSKIIDDIILEPPYKEVK